MQPAYDFWLHQLHVHGIQGHELHAHGIQGHELLHQKGSWQLKDPHLFREGLLPYDRYAQQQQAQQRPTHQLK